jgi:outer membrane protein assembly factor BamB
MKCVIAFLFLIGANLLWAQDWPQWRGPNRDGKVTGFAVPQTWPQQLTQQWKVQVGAGDTTPALVGDKLYAFGRQGADEVIRCLEAGTGKILWEDRYPAQHVVTGPPARHPGPRSSPVVADGKICTLGVGGILSCLDAGNGKVLWRKQSTNDFLGTAYRFDSSMSPIVVDGRCMVHVGGKGQGAVMAFDLASGEPKWKWDGEAPSSSSPVVMTVDGAKQLVKFTEKNLVGLDVADGNLLWKLPFEATQGNNTTPIIQGPIVMYTGQGKGMSAVKVVKQTSGWTVTPLWTNDQLGARFTTPVFKDGLLFGYNGRFFCANAQTGATLWIDTANHGNSAALLDAGPVILALTIKAELIAFRATDKEYAELTRIIVSDTETWAHPVVAGKRVYVRDQDSVTLWNLD